MCLCCVAAHNADSSKHPKKLFEEQDCSHDADFVGNLKGVVLFGEDHVGFLLATGGDHGVYLADLDRVEFLAGLLDHWLGRALVNNENKGVMVFNGLDGGLGAARVLNDGVLVPSVLLLYGVCNTFGLAGEGQSLGTSEGNLGPGLSLGGVVGALFHLRCCLLCLKYKRKLLPASSFISS